MKGKIKSNTMTVSGTVFLVVGFLHLMRILMSWDLIIANWAAPMWLSVLAFLLAWSLAYYNLKYR